jgi:hypothetical protein
LQGRTPSVLKNGYKALFNFAVSVYPAVQLMGFTSTACQQISSKGEMDQGKNIYFFLFWKELPEGDALLVNLTFDKLQTLKSSVVVDKVHKLIIIQYYIPSSKPFRIYLKSGPRSKNVQPL